MESDPPVCRILDYGKHKYLTEKQKKESRKKQQELKGIKFRPNSAEHDLQHLLRNGKKFLEEGDKLKVVCQFRAREITHPEIGYKKMEYFSQQLADYAIVESVPKFEGKLMIMIMAPKAPKSVASKKDGKEQDQSQQDSSKEI